MVDFLQQQKIFKLNQLFNNLNQESNFEENTSIFHYLPCSSWM